MRLEASRAHSGPRGGILRALHLRAVRWPVPLLLTLALQACATTGAPPTITSSTEKQAPAPVAGTTPAAATHVLGYSHPAPTYASASAAGAPTATAAAYVMTEEDKGLSCRQLTGRMQVRILQLRDYESQSKSSSIAQSLQKTIALFTPGDPANTVTDERYARDRAQLEAYNSELAAKGCKTFNLAAELGAHPTSHTPAPVE